MILQVSGVPKKRVKGLEALVQRQHAEYKVSDGVHEFEIRPIVVQKKNPNPDGSFDLVIEVMECVEVERDKPPAQVWREVVIDVIKALGIYPTRSNLESQRSLSAVDILGWPGGGRK